MEGQATYTCANGDMYQGAYKANKKHGKGMYHYKVRARCSWRTAAWAFGC